MKPISIHPFSALAGAGVLGLVLLATGAVQTSIRAQPFPHGTAGPVQVAGIPDPRAMLVIKEGTPFIVPAGKLLVLTGLGATTAGISVALLVDGQQEVAGVVNLPTVGLATVASLPPGLTVPSASTVNVAAGSNYGRAWGYLVDA